MKNLASVDTLTFQKAMELDFIRLARIVNTDSMSLQFREEACIVLRVRALKDMRGAKWMSRTFEEKATVRKAMTFGLAA